MPYGGLGHYVPRGYPFYQVPNCLQGLGAIDPACHAKYDLAWGQDKPPNFKAGELPPATPDPSQMFKDGFY